MFTLNSISALKANKVNLISIKIPQSGIKMSYDLLHKKMEVVQEWKEKRRLSLQGYGPATVICPDVLTASLVWEMINGGWIGGLRKVFMCESVYMR